MNKRRPRSDDVLFISALVALLLGVAFLLYTTGTFNGAFFAWPLLVVAAGGMLLYLALVRGSSNSFLFVGIVFVSEGAFLLVSIILGWRLVKAWPLGMAIAGFSGLITGLAAKRKMKVAFAVPSFSFVFLGLAFAIFSFGWAGIGFKSFIIVWWPTLLIVGGISLFVAYGLSRRSFLKRAEAVKEGGNEGAKVDAGKASVGRPGRNRGPTSGT
jgi:hypothetical protein